MFKYFVEWNSAKTTINASQLLIKLYEEEDLRFGVDYAKGVIDSMDRPLFPKTGYFVRKEASKEQGLDIQEVGSRLSNRTGSMMGSVHSEQARSTTVSKGFKRLKKAIDEA